MVFGKHPYSDAAEAAINIPFLRNSRGLLRSEKFVAKVGSVPNRTYRVWGLKLDEKTEN